MANYIKLCKYCNKEFIANRKKTKFCSKICSSTHTGLNNKGRKHTELTKRKISEGQTGEKNQFYGKKHTQEVKDKLRARFKGIAPKHRNDFAGEKNPFFGKKHSDESRAKMSKTRSEMIKSGQYNVYKQCRKGIYKNYLYDSYYELARIIQLEQDSNINNFCKNQKYAIQYTFQGQTKNYIPDFIIYYKTGEIVVEEVKGYERPLDTLKIEAAKEYFKKLNITYRVLYKYDIFQSNHQYRQFLKTKEL